MEPIEHIDLIEQRAEAVNLSLAAVCKRAGVRRHTISRWRSGDVSPTLKVLQRDLGKLSQAMDEIEREVFLSLQPKFSERISANP